MKRMLLAFIFCIMLLSVLGAETQTSEGPRNYHSRGELRLIPPNNPVRSEVVDRYTYVETTTETTYTLTTTVQVGEMAHSETHTYSSRSSAESARASYGNGSISSSSSVIREVERSGSTVVSTANLRVASGALPPGDIDDIGRSGQDSASEGLVVGERTVSVDPSTAISDSLSTTSGVSEAALAMEREMETREKLEMEKRESFTRRYGDPVKLATGAMSMEETDIRVVMPGRAEDFSITREYDSGVARVGFFGVGWTTGMEGRVLLGRDEAHWVDSARISEEIDGINSAIAGLDSVWESDMGSLAQVIEALENVIAQLERTRDGYRALSLSDPSLAGRAAYTVFANNSEHELAALEPFRVQLYARMSSIESIYNSKRQGLDQTLVELEKRLAYSEEQSQINEAIQARNSQLLLPGQARDVDTVGRENIVLFSPFGGNRQYTLDPEQSSDTRMVYTNEFQALDSFIVEHGRSLLSEAGGFSLIFDNGGRVLSRMLNDTLLYTFVYNADARNAKPGPGEIDLYGGRKIELEWNEDRQPKIAALRSGGRVIRRYAYTGDYLSEVLYPDGSFDRYSYLRVSNADEHERLYRIEFFPSAEEDSPSYYRQYNYDPNGRVVSVEDTRDLSESFSYQYQPDSDRIRIATYTDSSGVRRQYTFNELLQEVAVLSPVEGNTRYVRDELGRVLSQSDEEYGSETSFVYSADGTLTHVTSPGGGQYRMDYDSLGRMTYIRDPDGVSFSYEYDSRGNVSRIIYSDGSEKRYHYNNENLCTSYTDEEGYVWNYEYNDYGYLTGIRDPLGHETKMTYNDNGKVLSITDPELSQWHYEYDIRGLKEAEIDPLGFRREYIPGSLPEENSDSGNAGNSGNAENTGTAGGSAEDDILFHSAIWPENIRDSSFPGTIRWNSRALPESIVWSDGGEWTYQYSSGGRLVSATDPAGGVRRYAYNSRGFLTLITQANGDIEERRHDRRGLMLSASGERDTTWFYYDYNGRILAVENDSGVQTQYTRDRSGRVTEVVEGVSEQNPYGLRQRQYAYDAGGNIIRINEGGNSITTYEYDEQSRLISRTEPLGYRIRQSYSDSGRESRDSMGRTQAYYFDADGRLLVYEDPFKQRVRYEYEGDRVSVLSDRGHLWSFVYNAQGRRTELQYPDGNSEKTAYNDRGQITEQGIGGRRSRYEYDDRGNLVREITGIGEEYRYYYDEMNELVEEEHGDRSIEHSYSSGQRIASYDSEGNSLRYGYGADGKLESLVNGSGTVLAVYDYDDLGRLVATATPEILTRFQWGSQNQLLSSWDSLSDIEISYTYDSQGTLLALNDSSGFVQEMRYNEASEMTSLRLVAGNADDRLDFIRDALGRTVLIRNGDKTFQRMEYNEEGFQSMNIVASGSAGSGTVGGSSVGTSSGEQVHFAEVYAYDSSGRREYHIDSQARLTFYDYDNESQLSALYSPYQPDSSSDQVWQNPDSDSAQALSTLWERAGIPEFFSPYQLTKKEAFNYEDSRYSLNFDSRGNVSSWTDEDGRHALSYDSLGRVRSMSIENLLGTSECHYTYDGLSRLVMESCQPAGESGAFTVVYVHRGILPQPYMQLEYNTVTEEPRNANLRIQHLERRAWSSRYRHSAAPLSAASTSSVLSPAASLFNGREADRAIWYGYRAGAIQTASILENGQEMRNYMLSGDGTMNVRVISDMKGGEGRTQGYSVYGIPEAEASPSLPEIFPRFASVLHNRITGLSMFGYRFYSPRIRRFLSADPLKSGYDWFAYADNDPINYRDVLGLVRQGLLNFDINSERIHGVFYDDDDDTLDSLTFVDIFASNNQRARSNPTVDDSPGGQVLRTINKDGSEGEPYIPEGFPPGSHKVTGVYNRDSPIIGEFFVATDASKEVPVYERGADGNWRPQVDDRGNVVTVYDSGYGLHAGGTTANEEAGISPMENNDPNDTTLGCGRVSTQDIKVLAKLTRGVLEDGGTVYVCSTHR